MNAIKIQSYIRKNVFVDYQYEIEYEYDFSIMVFRLHIFNYHNTDPFHPMSYSLYLKPT